MDDLTRDSASGAPTLPVAAGLLAGRYDVRRRLGRGAVKEVYLARDRRLDRDVALAIVVGGGGDDAARARVAREAQATGRLGDHPNIITVYDSGEHDGVPYLVLRAMDGGSLADLLARERPSIPEAIRLGSEIAAALAHAHAHGVIHRDVKPDNVWLTADGDAALGDFGIAHVDGAHRLTTEGSVIGTLRYLSPEQARGEAVSPASDLYALGITLYELLTGRTPFTDPDPSALLAQHLVSPPQPPSDHEPAIPPALERLVLDLLAKRPEDRPAAAGTVAGALAAMLAGPAEYVPASRGNLVGRDATMARLSAAWEQALAGRPRIVVLTGEPGIGKTRCAEELARRVERTGGGVAWGVCAEPGGASAYWPWTRALRELGSTQAGGPLEQLLGGHPSAAATLSGPELDEARFRLFDAVATALDRSSRERPLLVMLEDLHWADRSSLDLLVHVARELRTGRILVAATCRSAPGADAAGVLAELARRPAFERVELRGLDVDDVGRYVALVTGRRTNGAIARTLHARTGGNPFYLSEVVRLLSEEGSFEDAVARGPVLPDAVREVVTARVQHLPDPTRAAVDAAAVAGLEFDAALVARVAGLSRGELLEALEPAVAQHIALAPPSQTGTWSFTHGIVRDVVYDALPVARRADLHGRLAALLDERRRRGRAQPAAELAHHRLEAARAGGDAEPAMRASLDAADDAVGRLAHAEAAVHFDGALEAADLADLADDLERCRILLRAARARRDAGQLDAAETRHRAAADVARQAGSAELFAEAVLGTTEWQSYGAFDEEPVALLREALALLPERDGALRAAVLGRLALRLDAQREQGRREELLDEAVAMARRLGDAPTLTRLLALSSLVRWMSPSPERRTADAAESIVLAQASGDRDSALWAHAIRFADCFRSGDLAAVDGELDAYARLARDLRHPYYGWCLTMMRATRATFDGRLDEAERLATEAVERNRVHEPDAEQEYTVQLLTLAVARGRPGAVDRAPLQGFAERYPDLPMWRAIAAFAACAAGDHDAARASFELLARDDFAAAAHDTDAVCTLSLAAETCFALDDVARAPVLLDLLRPHGDHVVLVERGWAAWGAAAHQLALLAALAGDEPLAASYVARALDLTRAWGARPWELRTLLAARRLGLARPQDGERTRALAGDLGVTA
jgi:hypothetical protein